MKKLQFLFLGFFLLFSSFALIAEYREYKNTIEATKVQTQNLSFLLEKKIENDLEKTANVLHFAESIYRLIPKEHKKFAGADAKQQQNIVSKRLRILVRSFEGIEQINFMNAKGDVIFASNKLEKDINLADRRHFKVLQNNPHQMHSFSNIIKARTTGDRSLAQLRAMRDEDGKFIGAISALIPLERIDNTIASVDVGSKGVTLLRNADTSVLLSRAPQYEKEDFNRPLPSDNPIFSKIAKGQKKGALSYVATTDGTKRLGAFKVLDDYPLYVQVSFAKDEYFSRWKSQASVVAFLLALLAVGLWIVSRQFQKSFQKEKKILAELDEQRLKFANMHKRTNAILNAQSDIVLVTSGDEIIEANRAFLKFTGFDSLEGFKQKHDCVCDLFVDEPPYIGRKVQRQPWSQYLLTHGDDTNLAKIAREGKEYIFKLYAQKLSTNSETVITMSDITDETFKERQIQNFAKQLPGTIFQYRLNNDGSSSFPFASESVYELFEYSAQELADDSEKAFTKIDRSDLQTVQQKIMQSAQTLQNWECDFRINHSSKGQIWVRGLAKPQRLLNKDTIWHGYIEDITQLKRKDEQIQVGKDRLELIISSTRIALWDWNLQDDYILWDKNAYEILGYTNGEFGVDFQTYKDLIHPDDSKPTMDAIEKGIQEHASFVIEHRLKLKKGGWKWIETRGKAVKFCEDGSPSRVVGTNIDIQKRKEQEIELEKINQHLEEEVANQVKLITDKDKLLQEQAKLAQMGEMIGAIAHQWRQPLNALSINIQNLDDDYEDGLIDEEFIDRFIQRQTKTIEFMSKTIDDFRSFFKTDKKKALFSLEKVALQVRYLLQAQLKDNNIELSIQGEDFTIKGYESEMKQVFLNLISNAKDAIISSKKSGSVEIILDSKSKTVTVKDSGGGAPEKILERIFDPYFTTKDPDKGTGIGLHMSRTMVVNHMNGQMRAYNDDEGLCVQMRFMG